MDTFNQQQYQAALSRGRPQHGRCDEFSLRHPPMRLDQRAKIFSPFAALKGFEDAVDAKRRVYVEKRELNEEEQAALDQALATLHERTRTLRLAKANRLIASVRYYVPCMDENHEAYGCRGSYETVTGVVWKVDPVLHKTLRIGDEEIEIADIAEIRIQEN